MFQTTRRRLALWYTSVTAVLLLFFASGAYAYVRTTLVERVDDTLNHVVEIVERSLIIEDDKRVNIEASFRNSEEASEDDRIDLEWFDSEGNLQWSTFSKSPQISLHVNLERREQPFLPRRPCAAANHSAYQSGLAAARLSPASAILGLKVSRTQPSADCRSWLRYRRYDCYCRWYRLVFVWSSHGSPVSAIS